MLTGDVPFHKLAAQRRLIPKKIHGGAQQREGNGRGIHPQRIEFHVVSLNQPHNQPALRRNQQPANEEQLFRSSVPRRQMIDQPHLFDKSAMMIGRRATGDKLEQIREHGAAQSSTVPQQNAKGLVQLSTPSGEKRIHAV
jgi:hypothetical protein